MTDRDGFIIPNAGVAAPNLLRSQPDQGDFQILGNNQYGVITGCKVTLNGNSVSVSGDSALNILVVNGEISTLEASSKTIGSGSTVGPRFDLVVYDQTNGFSVITGSAAINPVYPDIPSSATVLASVYIPTINTGNPVVTDKRNFLQTNVVDKDVTGTNVVVRSYGTSQPTMTIQGSGKISLGSGTSDQDAFIERTGVGQVTVSDELIADTVSAVSSATVNGKEVVTTETIQWGSGSTQPNITNADIGDIYVNNQTGSIFVASYNSLGVKSWINVSASVNPIGTVIMSFMTKEAATTYMPGWLALDGSTYPIGKAGQLHLYFPEWKTDDTHIKLPDMTQRFPIGANTASTIGTYTGNVVGSTFGTATATLGINNIPSHRHVDADQTSTGSGGLHSHSATLNGSGDHSHNFEGNGANHNHFSSSESNPIIGSNYNVSGNIGEIPDGYIPKWHSGVDSANTIWVRGSTNNRTSIPDPPLTIQSASHTHSVNVNQVSSGHTHTLPTHNSVGKVVPDPISITPPSLSLLFYIKT